MTAGELPSLRHIVLLQGCTAAQRDELANSLPSWVELLFVAGEMSSPAARNYMIRQLCGDRLLDPEAFVGFPDDDAWYPLGTLACVARQFAESHDLQLLLCRYGPNPASDCLALPANLQQALSRGACAAIFVRAGLLAELGGFHELLGLGTVLCGGEDTEFVHRAFHRANGRAAVLRGVLVGHAAADPVKKARYYQGGLAALMAHRRASPASRIALARKLAVGLWLVAKRRLTLRQFIASVRQARQFAEAIRIPPPPLALVSRTRAGGTKSVGRPAPG